MFKPRPFAEPVQPETATPEIQTKVELGNSGGDRLAGMQVSAPAPIQPKLAIGAPGDKYEQEADTIAETVMRMPAISAPAPVENPTAPSPFAQAKPISATIFAQAKPISAAIFAQAKPISAAITPVEPVIQMQPQPSESLSEEAGENKKGFIQRRIKVQAAADGSLNAPNSLENQISQSKNSGSPLAPQIRAYMEPRFGADFSSVRVHTDSQAVQMNRDLGAQAFTHGNHIYYGSGKSPGNNHLTAHELTHTIQQIGGDKLQSKVVNKIQKQNENIPKLSKISPIEPVVQRLGENDEVTKDKPHWEIAEREYVFGQRVAGVWHDSIPEIPKQFVRKATVGTSKTEEMAELISTYNKTSTLATKNRKELLDKIWKILVDWNWKTHNHKLTGEESAYFALLNGTLAHQLHDATLAVEVMSIFQAKNSADTEIINQIKSSAKFGEWLKKHGYIIEATGNFERWLQSTSIKQAVNLYKKFAKKETPETKKETETPEEKEGPYYKLNQQLTGKDTELQQAWKLIKDASRIEEGLEFYQMPEEIGKERQDMQDVQEKNSKTYGNEQIAKTEAEIKGIQEQQNQQSSAVAKDVETQLTSNNLTTTATNFVKENILDSLVKGPVDTIMDKITGLLERLGIGHLIKAYQFAKQAKKIKKQIKYYQEAAKIDTTKEAKDQEDLTLSAAADYAISKRKRALWESFFLAILRTFQGVCRILTLTTPAGPITEIIKFAASLLEKGIKVFHAIKGFYKNVKGTKGRHRHAFAFLIIDQAFLTENTEDNQKNKEKALTLIYNLLFRFSKQLSLVQKWLVKKIIAKINETDIKKIKNETDDITNDITKQANNIIVAVLGSNVPEELQESLKTAIVECITDMKTNKVKDINSLDKYIGKKIVNKISTIEKTPEYQQIAALLKEMTGKYPFLKSLFTVDLMEQMKSTPVY
ncbi:DUF4157 domain-containing protein [Planktothricoides sp. SR001]|uniref:eCIS core domain-containing protein n=1 Tax=Planktothricoides sp. SR001 TaxID=1705388 RepID=UPI001E2B81F9|nr:DUF4157 domain-containing protein [Planktothricoides sp. SR001]